MREREECDFGLQWFALNMAGTLLQSSPRGGNNGHHLAIERREGEDCWTIECAGYCHRSTGRIRSQGRITGTSQDERIGASEDLCCTESTLGKSLNCGFPFLSTHTISPSRTARL